MAIRLTRYSLNVTNAQLVNICSYLLVNYLVSKTAAISNMSSLFISLCGVTITLRNASELRHDHCQGCPCARVVLDCSSSESPKDRSATFAYSSR